MAGKVLIAVPTYGGTMHTRCAEAVANLDTDGLDVRHAYFDGHDCKENRNIIAERALKGGFDAVLMVDSDVVVPEKALKRLMSHGKGVVLGFYARKGCFDGTLCLFKKGGYRNAYTADDMESLRAAGAGAIEVHGGGFGCAYVSTDALRRMKRPFFDWICHKDGKHLTEDLYFCEGVRAAGMRVYADPSVGCSHIFQHMQHSM